MKKRAARAGGQCEAMSRGQRLHNPLSLTPVRSVVCAHSENRTGQPHTLAITDSALAWRLLEAPIDMLKADHGPIPPDARWITVHPNGPGSKGQPVLVFPAGEGGAMRVIGGAGGKLNMLKLQRVKSRANTKPRLPPIRLRSAGPKGRHCFGQGARSLRGQGEGPEGIVRKDPQGPAVVRVFGRLRAWLESLCARLGHVQPHTLRA